MRLRNVLLLFVCSTFFTMQFTSLGVETAQAAASKKRVATRLSPAKKLKKVCPRITNLSGLLIKTTAGGHIPKSDPRYSGFSIICGSHCVPFPATVYHCDGSVAFKMGYYGRWDGNGKSRGYCGAGGQGGCPTSYVRSKNRSLRCNGAVYLAQGGGRCMRFNINSNRSGGV
ncbi:MAG: hypothetical protein GYA55_01765 [SAR324 cluster bacterium]|uniref:DUF3761 domain-containing protein n=1 Tax=SAR324 cluster bacterium TaxID=2024889 RepID=A0A7X9IKE2_9DELT|nr:hypothetical protein [SAR324 cluster bacterium]